ncbi:C40 family peptidase [Pantoea sp. Mb-10]|uniref:C40 family peptidase n=1 Tax=unclassified Pantoea TaxID=2630326 RepID=UPI001E3AC7FD|nr:MULTISPECIES: C40 family peptidase [unclassified Pantoea]MCE0490779.1 C40 family peptidase [Pantoea sp. Mb-10]MCE0500063.1 C40 family peptidase [Pantoea sp. Pb-8]
MRLLITLFILAFAQLFFNVASASPHAPVNVSLHKADKKSAREDERRKRRPLKTTAKKSRLTSVQKLKLKKQLQTAKAPQKSARKKILLKSPVKKYGHQRPTKMARTDDDDVPSLTGIKMSKSHRLRYQKARETAMTKLMGQLGKPYQWGGTSPHTGFDCSGLVWYAYKDLVKYRFPRTANEMYHLRDASPIKRELLEKGDLVFFRINNRGTADHVGVYLGNGKFIQSPRTGKDIQISALGEDYWQKHYVGARRMMTPKTIR